MFVELPIDTLYSVQEVRANMGLSARKRRKELDALPQLGPTELRRLGPWLETAEIKSHNIRLIFVPF